MEKDETDKMAGKNGGETAPQEGLDPRLREDELTRREWFARVGKAAALVSLGGPVSTKGTAPVPPSMPEDARALPPGLYEASNDHLSHALTSDAQFHPIPPGTETDYARTATAPFEAQFFSKDEFEVVRRIVELVLGETAEKSSPGAQGDGGRSISAEVAEWIDLAAFSVGAAREAARRLAPEHRALAIAYYGSKAVEEIENSDPEKTYREGIKWLTEESERRFGKGFLALTVEQQTELLKSASDDRPEKDLENAGTRFFHLIKMEVLRGFYTSRAGLNELEYKGNTFYAESPGCPGEGYKKPAGGPGGGEN